MLLRLMILFFNNCEVSKNNLVVLCFLWHNNKSQSNNQVRLTKKNSVPDTHVKFNILTNVLNLYTVSI